MLTAMSSSSTESEVRVGTPEPRDYRYLSAIYPDTRVLTLMASPAFISTPVSILPYSDLTMEIKDEGGDCLCQFLRIDVGFEVLLLYAIERSSSEDEP